MVIIFIGCAGKNTSNKETDKASNDNKYSVKLVETFNEDDLQVNENFREKLNPIRINFKRINSIVEWTDIKTIDTWETNEGGEAKFYYLNGQLEKITTKHFGETFQLLTEYYLLKDKLSFVFEKSYKYNRPIYYDTTSAKANNDKDSFEFKETDIIVERSYFDNGKLVHQLNNQDCGSSSSHSYLVKEEIRIKTEFEKLFKLMLSK